MKKTFYIYWIFYVLLMMLMVYSPPMSLLFAKSIFMLLYLTWAFLGIMPMYIIYVYQEHQGKIDMVFLEGCLVSFILRSITTCFAMYGMENRWYILSLSGLIMLIFYLTRIRRVLIKI